MERLLTRFENGLEENGQKQESVESKKLFRVIETDRLAWLGTDILGELVAEIETETESLYAQRTDGQEESELEVKYMSTTDTRRKKFRSLKYYLALTNEKRSKQKERYTEGLLAIEHKEAFTRAAEDAQLLIDTAEMLTLNEQTARGTRKEYQENRETDYSHLMGAKHIEMRPGVLYSIGSQRPFQYMGQEVKQTLIFTATRNYDSIIEALEDIMQANGNFGIELGLRQLGSKLLPYVDSIKINGKALVDGNGGYFLESYVYNSQSGRMEIGKYAWHEQRIVAGEPFEIRYARETESGCGAGGYMAENGYRLDVQGFHGARIDRVAMLNPR